MKKYFFIISLISFAFMQYEFSLQDQNVSSPTYGQNIGPSSYLGQVTLYYFGHQN